MTNNTGIGKDLVIIFTWFCFVTKKINIIFEVVFDVLQAVGFVPSRRENVNAYLSAWNIHIRWSLETWIQQAYCIAEMQC